MKKVIGSLGVLAALGVAAVFGFLTAPEQTTEPVRAVATTTTAAPRLAEPVRIERKAPARTVKAPTSSTTSSTTTSEVPAPLTAEQEASIPDVEVFEREGMGPDPQTEEAERSVTTTTIVDADDLSSGQDY